MIHPASMAGRKAHEAHADHGAGDAPAQDRDEGADVAGEVRGFAGQAQEGFGEAEEEEGGDDEEEGEQHAGPVEGRDFGGAGGAACLGDQDADGGQDALEDDHDGDLDRGAEAAGGEGVWAEGAEHDRVGGAHGHLGEQRSGQREADAQGLGEVTFQRVGVGQRFGGPGEAGLGEHETNPALGPVINRKAAGRRGAADQARRSGEKLMAG